MVHGERGHGGGRVCGVPLRLQPAQARRRHRRARLQRRHADQLRVALYLQRNDDTTLSDAHTQFGRDAATMGLAERPTLTEGQWCA